MSLICHRLYKDFLKYKDQNFYFTTLKLTGALVSAGFEVSATVGLRHDDDLDEHQSGVLNTSTMKSSRSQFTTLNRTGDHKTMSEARSYDETTIHPPTRSLKTHYSGSSPSSRVNNDVSISETNTNIIARIGSNFISIAGGPHNGRKGFRFNLFNARVTSIQT